MECGTEAEGRKRADKVQSLCAEKRLKGVQAEEQRVKLYYGHLVSELN